MLLDLQCNKCNKSLHDNRNICAYCGASYTEYQKEVAKSHHEAKMELVKNGVSAEAAVNALSIGERAASIDGVRVENKVIYNTDSVAGIFKEIVRLCVGHPKIFDSK